MSRCVYFALMTNIQYFIFNLYISLAGKIPRHFPTDFGDREQISEPNLSFVSTSSSSVLPNKEYCTCIHGSRNNCDTTCVVVHIEQNIPVWGILVLLLQLHSQV